MHAVKSIVYFERVTFELSLHICTPDSHREELRCVIADRSKGARGTQPSLLPFTSEKSWEQSRATHKTITRGHQGGNSCADRPRATCVFMATSCQFTDSFCFSGVICWTHCCPGPVLGKLVSASSARRSVRQDKPSPSGQLAIVLVP